METKSISNVNQKKNARHGYVSVILLNGVMQRLNSVKFLNYKKLSKKIVVLKNAFTPNHLFK